MRLNISPTKIVLLSYLALSTIPQTLAAPPTKAPAPTPAPALTANQSQTCLDNLQLSCNGGLVYNRSCFYLTKPTSLQYPDGYTDCDNLRKSTFNQTYSSRPAPFNDSATMKYVIQTLVSAASLSTPINIWLAAQLTTPSANGALLSDYCWMTTLGSPGSQITTNPVPVNLMTNLGDRWLFVNSADLNTFNADSVGPTTQQTVTHVICEFGCESSPPPAVCPNGPPGTNPGCIGNKQACEYAIPPTPVSTSAVTTTMIASSKSTAEISTSTSTKETSSTASNTFTNVATSTIPQAILGVATAIPTTTTISTSTSTSTNIPTSARVTPLTSKLSPSTSNLFTNSTTTMRTPWAASTTSSSGSDLVSSSSHSQSYNTTSSPLTLSTFPSTSVSTQLSNEVTFSTTASDFLTSRNINQQTTTSIGDETNIVWLTETEIITDTETPMIPETDTFTTSKETTAATASTDSLSLTPLDLLLTILPSSQTPSSSSRATSSAKSLSTYIDTQTTSTSMQTIESSQMSTSVRMSSTELSTASTLPHLTTSIIASSTKAAALSTATSITETTKEISATNQAVSLSLTQSTGETTTTVIPTSSLTISTLVPTSASSTSQASILTSFSFQSSTSLFASLSSQQSTLTSLFPTSQIQAYHNTSAPLSMTSPSVEQNTQTQAEPTDISAVLTTTKSNDLNSLSSLDFLSTALSNSNVPMATNTENTFTMILQTTLANRKSLTTFELTPTTENTMQSASSMSTSESPVFSSLTSSNALFPDLMLSTNSSSLKLTSSGAQPSTASYSTTEAKTQESASSTQSTETDSLGTALEILTYIAVKTPNYQIAPLQLDTVEVTTMLSNFETSLAETSSHYVPEIQATSVAESTSADFLITLFATSNNATTMSVTTSATSAFVATSASSLQEQYTMSKITPSTPNLNAASSNAMASSDSVRTTFAQTAYSSPNSPSMIPQATLQSIDTLESKSDISNTIESLLPTEANNVTMALQSQNSFTLFASEATTQIPFSTHPTDPEFDQVVDTESQPTIQPRIPNLVTSTCLNKSQVEKQSIIQLETRSATEVLFSISTTNAQTDVNDDAKQMSTRCQTDLLPKMINSQEIIDASLNDKAVASTDNAISQLSYATKSVASFNTATAKSNVEEKSMSLPAETSETTQKVDFDISPVVTLNNEDESYVSKANSQSDGYNFMTTTALMQNDVVDTLAFKESTAMPLQFKATPDSIKTLVPLQVTAALLSTSAWEDSSNNANTAPTIKITSPRQSSHQPSSNTLTLTKATANDHSASVTSPNVQKSMAAFPACKLSEWSDYSPCAATCGDNVPKTRWRKYQYNNATNASESVNCPSGMQDTLKCQLPKCITMTKTEKLISKIGMSIGCAWLIAALASSIVVAIIKRSKTYLSLIHSCEDVSIILAHILVLAFAERTEDKSSEDVCKVAALGMQYLYLAAFSFQLMEALYIYTVLTSVTVGHDPLISLKWTIAFCLGMPVIVTSLTAGISYSTLVSTFSCWINYDDNVYLATFVPMLALACPTIILVEAAGEEIIFNATQENVLSCRISRGGLALVTFTQFTSWFLGTTAMHYQQISYFVIVFGLNVTLGVFIYLYHLFSDAKVRNLATKMFRHAVAKVRPMVTAAAVVKT